MAFATPPSEVPIFNASSRVLYVRLVVSSFSGRFFEPSFIRFMDNAETGKSRFIFMQ